MSDPMPEAVEAAAAAEYENWGPEKWSDLNPEDRRGWLDDAEKAVAAAEPIIRADERAQALAPIRALIEEWEDRGGKPCILPSSLRAALGDS